MMRKSMLFVLTMIVLMIPAFVFADNVTVLFNGEKLAFPDVKPFINTDSRTMIPLRFVSETLGAEVDWNAHTKTVSIAQDETNIELTIGANYALKNGQTIPIDTRAIIYYDRTFVPLRFVSEVLGATVDWNANTKTVSITKEKPVVEKPIEKPPVVEKPKIDVPTTGFQPTKPGEMPEERLSKERHYYYVDRAIETIQYENDVFTMHFPELEDGYYYSVDYGIIDNLGNRKQTLVHLNELPNRTVIINTAGIQRFGLSILVYNSDHWGRGGTNILFPEFTVNRDGGFTASVSDYQK